MQSTIYLDCLRKVLSIFVNIPNAHTMCHINFWKNYLEKIIKNLVDLFEIENFAKKVIWKWKLAKKSLNIYFKQREMFELVQESK